MSLKSVLVALLAVAAVSALPVQVQQHEAPAHYEFTYTVNDEHTGDIKSQQESRHGDAVTGRYELIDSDGFKRIVEYTADEHTGFNAVVRREPTHIKIPVTTAVHYTQQHAAPAHFAAPAHYAAPATVQHVKYATPTPVQHFADAAHTTAAPATVQYLQHQQQQPTYAGKSHQFTHEASHVVFNAPGINYNF